MAHLRGVCGSEVWARAVAAWRPFEDRDALLAAAEAAWDALEEDDWREAFAAHPRIGESRTAAGEAAGAWSRGEQAGTAGATRDVMASLADAQRRYENRFGHGFLVCATGESAEAMLAACEERMGNDPAAELGAASEEERKIGRLRLEKLLAGDDGHGSDA